MDVPDAKRPVLTLVFAEFAWPAIVVALNKFSYSSPLFATSIAVLLAVPLAGLSLGRLNNTRLDVESDREPFNR